ncbi:MAG TPA: GH92 family glycosyl hydrolase, partial [Tichowtungia sp.]|nr:GH92 family glycosyl hydrolase [Tichowtungia sp.]
MRQAYGSGFSHEFETSLPGYYRVLLQDENIQAELTASERCGVHRYTYPAGSDRKLVIDLLHGARGSCTIVKEDNKAIVHDSFIRQVDEYTIEGYRVSSSWAKYQHAYFSAKFSEPISEVKIFSQDKEVQTDSLHCTRLKAILDFGVADRPLEIKVGISPVSMEGARSNLKTELGDSGFNEVCAQAVQKWEKQLSKFQIQTDDEDLRTIFYTCLHNVFLYPMLYSDVDGKFRGPDHEVHQADGFDYYAGVLGLWDNFRAANPLLTIANPGIANEQIQTFLAHYDICGLLPIWTLAGHETLTMIGYHAMPVIADAYYKGVRDYDADAVFEAMKASANKDEFGLSMRRMMGTKNYKKYGYIPADVEFESVAQTLEFAYDDWCIAQMAKMLGRDEDYETFMERSKSYRHVIDPETKFARGRMTDGSWRTPFDPRASTHRRDDYCEGTAWQWTFFVPHDPAGLADIMGGKAELEKKLDGLLAASSETTGGKSSGAISGLIGQYAHGNEPSHHVAYLYNFTGAPWKTQSMVDQIFREMYANNPDGVCGNDDTG